MSDYILITQSPDGGGLIRQPIHRKYPDIHKDKLVFSENKDDEKSPSMKCHEELCDECGELYGSRATYYEDGRVICENCEPETEAENNDRA